MHTGELPLRAGKKKLVRRKKRLAKTDFNFGASLEGAAFFGLLLVAVLTAIPYGTVDQWWIALFVVLVCCFGVVRIAADLINKNFSFADSKLLLPLIGILILAATQTVSIGFFASSLGITNSETSAISANIFETFNFIFTFAGLLIAGEILLKYSTTEKRLNYLILVVLFVGIASALFGLARILFLDYTDSFKSVFNVESAGYAQFINRNHFAFLMEMTLGLLVGLRLKLEMTDAKKLLFGILIGFICLSIILASSRGGILSMVGLILVAILLHISARLKDKSHNRKSAFRKFRTALTAFVIGFVFLVFSIFAVAFIGGDRIVSRFEKIQDEVDAEENEFQRKAIWNSTLKLIESRPIFGSGLGAYQTAITKFDQTSGKSPLQEAHNDYLELLAGGGIAAFALALIFLTTLFQRINAKLQSRDKFSKACALGSAVGIFGVLLHNFVDYGLHAVANAFIFTILVVIASARIIDSEKEESAK
jgi:O-antigen ligase